MGSQSPKTAIASDLEAARAQVYREHALQAAERVFARHGYAKATIREIAGEAGISVGSVYGVFEGKAGLFREVEQRHHVALAKQSVAAAQASSDVVTILMEGARVTVEYFCRHQDYLRIQIRRGRAWALGEAGDGPADAAWEAGWRLLSQTIERGITAGELRPGKPERHARVILAVHQALLADWLDAGAEAAPAEVVAELQDMIRRLLVD